MGLDSVEGAWLVFVVREVCEKYLMYGKDVFLRFMDLEKEHDKIVRHGMRRVCE